MIEKIHQNIYEQRNKLDQWFREKVVGLDVPIYSSYDIRDSEHIIAPVDANLFPAGFNNICDVDKDLAKTLFCKYIHGKYGQDVKTVVLLTEEHTSNKYYFENVFAIESLLKDCKLNTFICFPNLTEKMTVENVSGETRDAFPLADVLKENSVDLVICNNDFSLEPPSCLHNLNCPIDPPIKMGWYQRRKDRFFECYNELASEFSNIISIEPGRFSIETRSFGGFDLSEDSAKTQLAEAVDSLLSELKSKYDSLSVPYEPTVFIKNSAGTYGLGVMSVQSAQDVLNLNYKTRKKMKATKGGGGFDEVILQEGIPSSISADDATAEPVIYTVGKELAGGFLRAHDKKGPQDSLNSPGAVYKRLCLSDLEIKEKDSPLESVYGWVARLGMISVAREIKNLLSEK